MVASIHFGCYGLSRIILRGDAKRHMVRQLARPRKVDANLPPRPAPAPPDYKQVASKVQLGELQEAMVEWYSAARQEWTTIAGVDLSYKAPRFRWAGGGENSWEI